MIKSPLLDLVKEKIVDKNVTVIAIVAPTTSVAIGEHFGYKPGENKISNLVSSLKKLGFDKVFDIGYTADIVAIEEVFELLERKVKNENLPMLTSCCPSWINFLSKQFPHLAKHVSTMQSPMTVMGSIIKSFYAENEGLDSKNVFVVGIMPCPFKTLETNYVSEALGGLKPVDVSLTVNQIAGQIKEAGIDFNSITDFDFDAPFNQTTDVAHIFGYAGGVGESVVEFAKRFRPDIELKLIKTSGIENAKSFLEALERGEVDADVVEFMACSGGCVGGFGMACQALRGEEKEKLVAARKEGLKKLASEKKRKTYQATEHSLFKNWLGTTYSETSKKYLHKK